MTKPTTKQVSKVKQVLEGLCGRPCITTTADDHLVSIYYPPNTKIHKDITDLRKDLDSQGFFFFYSTVLHKGNEVLSFNITKR